MSHVQRFLSISLVLLASACGGAEQIVHGLTEFEANEILVVLEAKGISGDKVLEAGRVVTWAVSVAEMDSKDARRILVANHLPRERSQGFPEVYPPGGGGLIPTKSEEKAKFLMAMQGEIEQKLKSMPGIVAAHVSVVQPDKDVVRDLDAPPPLSTASVAIVYNAIDERGTSAVTMDDVRNLVASSVEELKPANVTVVMKRNVPAVLVEQAAETGTVDAPVAAVTAYGLKFADKKSSNRITLYGIMALATSALCLAVGIGGIVRAMGLKRRAARAEAELTSQRKARRETQTGLQQT